jgi:tripartite-type tricarboxylate transporter receptor subunit TctC
MLIAHPSSVSSVKELIAVAKAKPGYISFSHTGSGTGTHLAAELFKSAAGVDLLSVPYKNITAAIIAVMSGEVPISFVSIYSALAAGAAGKAKALAVTGEKRSAARLICHGERIGLPVTNRAIGTDFSGPRARRARL